MVLALRGGRRDPRGGLLGLFLFGLRRRLIQRPGGTFDCSLRLATEPDASRPGGKGWVYGVARYSGDRVEWFRVFSYAPRPRRVLERPAIEVLGAASRRARRNSRCCPTRWCSPASTAAPGWSS